MTNHNFFFLQNYVDSIFASSSVIDHEAIATNFQIYIHNNFSDDSFSDLLICSGFIPDLYKSDSSQETLFSKLTEVLVCEWAQRMGFSSKFIKQKSSYEDVCITLANKVIVCDAKSFRLGRSQAAPNVKDFIKLEDIRKWLSRYQNKLGGLVTYPSSHDWSRGSDAYQYCTDRSIPTVMLPYKYLSYLLKYKSYYDTTNIISLWDYNTNFPNILSKNMTGGNRIHYWDKINSTIIQLTNTSWNTLKLYMDYADTLIEECVRAHLLQLINTKESTRQKIIASVNAETDIAKLKTDLIYYRTIVELNNLDLDTLIDRISKFRLHS